MQPIDKIVQMTFTYLSIYIYDNDLHAISLELLLFPM